MPNRMFIGPCQRENKHGPWGEVSNKANTFLLKTLLHSEIIYFFIEMKMTFKYKMIVYIDKDFLGNVFYVAKQQSIQSVTLGQSPR